MIKIIPDNNFKLLLTELNKTIEQKIDINLNFILSVDRNRLNTINLDFSLPIELRGLDIGYKIYQIAIKNFNFITSDFGLSNYARNIWYKLICDNNYYSYTSGYVSNINNGCSGVIKKDISDDKLKDILDNIKQNINIIYNKNFNDLIFDKFLLKKIKNFYGNN